MTTHHPIREPYEQGLETDPRMTTNRDTVEQPTGREAAVESGARGLHVLLELEDGWDSLTTEDRDAYRAMADSVLAALADANLLATEQETQVRITYRYGVNGGHETGRLVNDIENTVKGLRADVERRTMGPVKVTSVETRVVSRRVTAWTEVAK